LCDAGSFLLNFKVSSISDKVMEIDSGKIIEISKECSTKIDEECGTKIDKEHGIEILVPCEECVSIDFVVPKIESYIDISHSLMPLRLQ
jgi:hypothetical protein